jgi:hypothetical protein
MSNIFLAGPFLAGLLAVASPALAEPIVVVVDRDNPKTDVSLDELKSYYTGKRHEWPDGARVVLLDLESGAAERAAFETAALGMSATDYDRWWVDQKVRGQGSAPKATSAGAAVKLAAKMRGAIAYVRASQVDASVKVLTVNGVAPGGAGYPISAP